MKTINGLENILLKELESGNSVNDEVLSLLPTKQFPIDNSAKYVLSHFENLNSIYVLKVSDLKNISLISDEMNSAGILYLVISDNFNSMKKIYYFTLINKKCIHLFRK